MITFIGRQYYRLMMGSGTTGLVVSAFFLVFNTYGIWKQSLQFYDIPLIPFVLVGLVGLASLYWGSGYFWERIGLYREYQSHANKEVNPEWVDAYSKIKQIAKKFEVE
jgi:hypothetical protein